MAIPRQRKRKGELDPAADDLNDLWDAFFVAVESTQVSRKRTNAYEDCSKKISPFIQDMLRLSGLISWKD
ncbi:hypothetical protein E2562_027439 [Oryza meyeriana var. granulata]|uniref:Uncharacterized protein n=1 Tax=Oryza meyeriana var. granulata TaxID=110450 RepID=A0A6G1CIY1_9ORYZ|nr:hypothetical protein E2562_027439 [Oryza meyeriana var. granulata]